MKINKLKKILFIVTKPDLGGAQRHVVDMNKYMNSLGWHSQIIVGNGTNEELKLFRKFANTEILVNQYMQREINIFKDIIALLKLIIQIKQIKPDLISLHSSKAGIIGRLACKFTRTKCIFTAHGWSFRDINRQKWHFLWFEKILHSSAKKIIAVSEYDRQLGLGFIPTEKLLTIHNGVKDVSIIKKDYETNSILEVIMIGRFQIPKDHELVLKAAKKLENVNFTFVGNGPHKKKIEKKIIQMNLSDRVRILEHRFDIPDLLQKADIFLLASNFEGLPRSILEAMRAGLPIITSAVGGCPELIRDGENGYLITPGDEDELSHKIKKLQDNQSLREKFGEQARIDFIKHFKFEIMAGKTVDIYQEIIDSD